MSLPRILLVDDHEEIRENLSEYLKQYGFAPFPIGDGKSMRSALEAESFDLILLDVMLPDAHGFSLCRMVQERWQIPVILLTSLSAPVDRVTGLELGAYDYVVKPFDPRELVARIRNVLRHRQSALPATPLRNDAGVTRRYEFDAWLFDLDRHMLTTRAGHEVSLSSAEFRLLQIFVESPNRVLTREQLQEKMWKQGRDTFDRSIDTHISRLRRKLGDLAREPKLLKTIWGDGYLFAATVKLNNA